MRVNLLTYENKLTTKSMSLSWKMFILDFLREIKPQASKFFKIKIKQSIANLLTFIKNFLL